uniref:C2 domain-containing protein n=1 Tax=Plectus sambesii TaxID=2011161 RepID=A0A914UVK6_9BILA
MAAMARSGGRERPQEAATDIDDLLVRVRGLQKILPELARYRQAGRQQLRQRAETDGRPMGRTTTTRSSKGVDRRNDNARRQLEIPLVRNIVRDVEQPDQNTDETVELLRLVTFVRVVVDSLYLNWEGKPAADFKELFGRGGSPRTAQLVLDYEFPTNAEAERSIHMLSKRVRTCAKTVLPHVAHFNHRRVALAQVTSGVVHLWSKSRLTLRVYYQLPNAGKFATRYIGKCEIDLAPLLVVPFSINVNAPMDMAGSSCRGYLQVCIQLGSRNAAFAERLEALRTPSKRPIPEPYRFVDPNVLSARLDRPGSSPDFGQGVAASNSARSPNFGQGIAASNSARSSLPDGLRPRVDLGRGSSELPHKQGVETVTQSTGAQTDDSSSVKETDSSDNETDPPAAANARLPAARGTVADRLRRLSNDAHGYLMQLTVHSARRLPHVKGANNEPVRPSVFVSYRGDQELKTSTVVPESTDPVWEWTTEFAVPPNRKNIVLKFWHRCPIKGDHVLGFVCLDLPPKPPCVPIKGTYDLVDLSQSSTGRVKLTLRPLAVSPRKQLLNDSLLANDKSPSPRRAPLLVETAMNTTRAPRSPPRRPPLSPIEPYLDMASRSLLADQLRTNLQQLDVMMRRLPL